VSDATNGATGRSRKNRAPLKLSQNFLKLLKVKIQHLSFCILLNSPRVLSINPLLQHSGPRPQNHVGDPIPNLSVSAVLYRIKQNDKNKQRSLRNWRR